MTKQEYAKIQSARFEANLVSLIESGFPDAAGLSEYEFKNIFGFNRGGEYTKNYLWRKAELEFETLSTFTMPFSLVIPGCYVSIAKQMQLLRWGGTPGKIKMIDPGLMPDYLGDLPTDFGSKPTWISSPYLIFGIKTGVEEKETGWPPILERMKSQGRRPLTMAEGVALVRDFPTVFNDKGIKGLYCFATQQVVRHLYPPYIGPDSDGRLVLISDFGGKLGDETGFYIPSCFNWFGQGH